MNVNITKQEVIIIKVLSLFDGMSCGRIALEKIGIIPSVYYASEIKDDAIQVTQENYPDTIQLGDITELSNERIQMLGNIDLLIGGSLLVKTYHKP